MNTITLKSFGALLGGIALSTAVHSESIQEWPSYKGLNLEPMKARFIEVFESEPSNLDQLTPGFVDCQLDSDKAGKLSGINEEAMLSVYADNKDIKVALDLDIDVIKVSSTKQGCAALTKVQLKPIPGNKYKYFQVPKDFSHNYLIYADYKTSHEYVHNINGKEHKSETSSENETYSFMRFLNTPIDPLYPKEFYSITKIVMPTIEMKSYSINMSPNVPPDVGIINIALTRSKNGEKLSNSLMVSEKPKGHDNAISIIGNHTITSMLDGNMHGLMISDNYMYASDKTQDPYMNSCYNMGEKYDVFKIVKGNKCIKVGDDQIGQADVYVDAIYQMGLDSKKRQAKHARVMADIKQKQEESVKQSKASKKGVSETLSRVYGESSVEKNKRLEKQRKQEKKDAKFAKTKQNAKCQLENNNWAYLSTNCKNGLAEGEGSSIDRQGLTFEGTFKAGQRVKGDISQNGEMIFSGDLKNDKPDGSAICLFEGEYEECRFFRGKRIDTLYKIRKENAKNLAKIEKIQKENALAAQRSNSSNSQSKQSNAMVDALEKEGTKRAAAFIFDQLF